MKSSGNRVFAVKIPSGNSKIIGKAKQRYYFSCHLII